MCVRVFSSICFIFYGSCRQRAHTVFFPFLDLGREICMCLYASYTAVFVEIHWTNQWKSFSDDLAHFTHMIFPFPLIWDTPRHSTCVDSMVSSILRNIPTYFMWLFIIYLSWFEFEGKASIACSLAYNPIKRADCWKCKCTDTFVPFLWSTHYRESEISFNSQMFICVSRCGTQVILIYIL